MNGNDAMNEGMRNEQSTQMQMPESWHGEHKDWQEPTPSHETVEDQSFPWLRNEEIDSLRSRWDRLQIEFVDKPHDTVEQANALLGEAFEHIEQSFANQRTALNEKWNNGKEASTEDLRVALQSYRSFLNRLLTL